MMGKMKKTYMYIYRIFFFSVYQNSALKRFKSGKTIKIICDISVVVNFYPLGKVNARPSDIYWLSKTVYIRHAIVV